MIRKALSRGLSNATLSVSIALAVTGCRADDDVADKRSMVIMAPKDNALSQAAENLAKSAKKASGFNLMEDAEEFAIVVEGCQSGYTTTMTQANPRLMVYTDDYDCKAKLQKFTYDEEAYTAKKGKEFKTYAVGEKALFASPSGNEVQVEIVQQLSSPTTATDKVDYRFNMGDEVNPVTFKESFILKPVPGTPSTISADFATAPDFKIVAGGLSSLEPSTGAGRFQFMLECNKKTSHRKVCSGVELADISYVLVKDPQNGPLCTDKTVDRCAELFKKGGPVKIDMKNEFIRASTKKRPSNPANGGFVTKSGDQALASPPQLENNNHLILILRNGNTNGFQLLPLEITTSVDM